MIPVPKQAPAPPIKRLSAKGWDKGTTSAFTSGRTPTDGLVKSANMMLAQDGTLRPRPSLIRYGTQPTGTVLGSLYEFVDVSSGTPINCLISMQNVAGETNIYWTKDGGDWTIDAAMTPISFDDEAGVRYCQIDDKVLIMNKTDPLAYFDIASKTVIQFTELSTPGTPTIGQTGMSGSTYTYYYKITANSTVGETDSSAEVSQQVSTLRESWTPGSQYITLSWSAVTDAVSYNVYLGVVSGDEYLLAANVNALTFKDDGSLIRDVSRAAPAFNSTAGPKVRDGVAINGQVFLWGDADDPFIIRYGGTPGTPSVLDFSVANGGGTQPIGRGTKEIPACVKSFRTGKGDSAITVLCKGPSGTGKRYLMTPDSITQGTVVINFFDVIEDNGQAGTDSPDGVILYRDNLWYPSVGGFQTTGTKPTLQNILSTQTISESINEDIKKLNPDFMESAVGLGNLEKLYWALPVGDSKNNQIWVLDLARNGAWMEPWVMRCDWMLLYNSNSPNDGGDGAIHHLIMADNVIYELSDIHPTNDDGSAFPVNATSGIFKFSDDSLEWAKVIDVTFILINPQGEITFSVSGRTEDAELATVGDSSFDQNFSVGGWGETGWGGSPDGSYPHIFGWSNFETVPETFGSAQEIVTVEVDEELEWVGWELNSNKPGVFFELADVIVRYVDIGVKDLT
jgi:hypothetical protein